MAHRYLIGAALSKEKCVISGIDFSEDILATIDCLKAMGVEIQIADDTVTVNAECFMKSVSDVMNCRESGSTLRFFIPLALCSGKKITLQGSPRLFERPLDVYEKLCADNGFEFRKNENSVTVCGNLKSGKYEMTLTFIEENRDPEIYDMSFTKGLNTKEKRLLYTYVEGSDDKVLTLEMDPLIVDYFGNVIEAYANHALNAFDQG
jgi:hypothetical protein